MLDLTQPGPQLTYGGAGLQEVLLDQPAGPTIGVAIVAHPQPLLGGSALHKVPHFLARSLADAGWCVLRPNFRGIGRSDGAHDAGRGEAEDLLTLVREVRRTGSASRLALVGFSFGAYVQACVALALQQLDAPADHVALAGLPFAEAGGRRYDTPADLQNALVVHGERDERVPLGAVFDWARPQGQPVVVVPGADHSFTGKLPVLRQLILTHLYV